MRTPAAAMVAFLLLGMASPPAAVAWSPASQVSIALESARLAPSDLRRQIFKHSKRLQAGALAPFRQTEASSHYWHEDGAGELDRVLFREIQGAIEDIQNHRPFGEIVYRLGVISHYIGDANNPLNAAGDDPQEARYYADYLRYMQSAEPRFALVFYAGEPEITSDRQMRLLVYRALYRGRQLYPMVGAEYRRIGFGSGLRTFDDRSTAFGVAAVSFSHAVSDMARVLRYIWQRAGGAADDTPLWRPEEDRVIVLPRSAGAR